MARASGQCHAAPRWHEIQDRACRSSHRLASSGSRSLSAGYFHLAGLPSAQCQTPLDSPLGRLYPDFYWPDAHLIGECDGAVRYADSASYVQEKEREQALRDLGYSMVRWLAKEIMLTPHLVIDRVARALG